MKKLISYFIVLSILSCSKLVDSNDFLGKWIRLSPKMYTGPHKTVVNEYLTITDNNGNVNVSKTDDYSIKEKHLPKVYTALFESETNTLALTEGPFTVRFSIGKDTQILNAGFLGEYKRKE